MAPAAPLSPAHEINREIVEQILSTTEWREMRESGTVGDPLSSAMATIGCTASAIAALDKETIRYLNQLHELSSEVERLFAHAEALDELAALSPDEERSEQLKKEAARARADAAKKEKRADREIERLLPSEIALLADPDLEDLFYLRFAEHGLMQYDLIGHEPEGQGPIIIAVDESGSSQRSGRAAKDHWSRRLVSSAIRSLIWPLPVSTASTAFV